MVQVRIGPGGRAREMAFAQHTHGQRCDWELVEKRGDRPIAVPDELPILPLRDTVLFPNSFMPLAVARESSVRLIDEAPTGASATCWVAPAGPFLFASNAGSASESGYLSSSGGQLTLLGAAATDPGTVDASAAAGGWFGERPGGVVDSKRGSGGR